jgi:hypothetical protein
MATQTIQFRSPPSQTVTLRLFVAGSDTQISSAAATEATNRKGTYTAAFTDVPAAEYQYIATIGTSPIIPVASGYVKLTLTTATFQTYDAAKAVNLSEVVVPPYYTPDEIVRGIITGTVPNGSLAKFVRSIKMADVLFEGQIVTATTQTATLDAGATSVCFGQAITIGEEGDVDRQTRFIVGFDAATKVITLDMPWCVIPPDGRDYSIKVLRNALAGDLDKSRAGSYGAAIADTKADTTAILASAGVNILPAVGISASRAPGVFLSPFVGELISQSITVYASDGTTPIDLSGKTLEIVFEARGGGDVAVIADGDITISGDDDNVVTFAYPSAVTAQERTLRFSLRDAGTPFTVYLTGLCKVSIAPSNDPA